jgi:O-acetylhomoserine (thiol)-lyase
MERAGHVYSRISNPTNAVLEERIAALEGGVGAIAAASGQAALHLAIATLMGAGAHIVASRSLYGGSHNLLEYTLPRFGITTTFIDPRDLGAWRAAIRPETRLLFGETLGNPGLDVLDVPAVAEIAHAADLPLMVDSTFTTPYLMRPFDLGADLLFHSATKFLGGHGVAIGGLLVDSGKFDWEASGKFPTLTEAVRRLPRHGLRRGVHRRRLPAAGAARGPARLRRLHEPDDRLPAAAGHRDAAAAHAAPRRQHAQGRRPPRRACAAVESVSYPELESHPDHALAQRLLPKGCGSVFSFVLKGGRPAGRKFIESLRVFSHLANVGDAKSLVIHPASTTHFRMSDEALRASGIHEGTVRLSIGLEDPQDLIADLEAACARPRRLDHGTDR